MKIEILPRAEEDIIRQFRYYLVDQEAASVAFRFREAVIESIEKLRRYPGNRESVSRVDSGTSVVAS